MATRKKLFMAIVATIALALAVLGYFLLRKSPEAPVIDEKYAAKVVKNALALSGTISAQKLAGGLGGAQLFRATDGLNDYVIRFVQSGLPREHLEQRIYDLKVASDGGYGPHVYLSDPSRGWVIMEYLPNRPISHQELQSGQWDQALAHLLQKIHRGGVFTSEKLDVFEKISRDLNANKSKCSTIVSFAKIEQIVTAIRNAVAPHQTTAPTHNDLHKDNLRFWENECKAVDYDGAGPGDPYFDVATIANWVGFSAGQARENALFTQYLGRQPSAVEEARLYLMKQAVLLKWATGALTRLSPEHVHLYESIKASSIRDFERDGLFVGKVDLSKPEDDMQFLKALLKAVFENFDSPDFQQALNVLSRKNV
jgi:hypothetical protein